MTTCRCGHELDAHQTGEGPWTGFCGEYDCECEGPTTPEGDDMTATTVRYTVYVGGDDLSAFIDMLRYENARVVTWDRVAPLKRSNAPRYRVTLEAAAAAYQPDRWASFLIPTERIG